MDVKVVQDCFGKCTVQNAATNITSFVQYLGIIDFFKSGNYACVVTGVAKLINESWFVL